MPLTRESLATEAQSYANLGIFIGPVDHLTSLHIDISGLTDDEVDSDGYLKPGVPFSAAGTLIADLSGDFEALISGGAAGNHTVTGIKTGDRLVSVIQIAHGDKLQIAGGAAGDHTVSGVGASDRIISVIQLGRQAQFTCSGGAAGALTCTGVQAEDRLVQVYNETDDADLTSEFSITGDDTIDNTGGTATTGDVLRVVVDRPAVDLTSEFSVDSVDTINNDGGTATTGETLEVEWETPEVDLTSEFSITAANTINNAGGTATTGEQLRVSYESETFVYGVTVAPVRIGYYNGAYGNSAAILAGATDVSVAVALRGVINQAVAEDQLGRAYTANELAAFKHRQCMLQIR